MKKIVSLILAFVMLAATCTIVSFAENEDSGLVKYYDYSLICSGLVDKILSGYTTEAVEDGISTICFTPNPEHRNDKGESQWLALDNFSLENKLKVNLETYKYVTLTYKYESPNPRMDVIDVPYINITRSKMLSVAGVPLVAVDATPTANTWTTVLYKIPDLSPYYLEPEADHFLRQFHFQPFGKGVNNDMLTKDDKIYIKSITFHEKEPTRATVVLPYITGVGDGLFGIGQTMTRAQACTVVARLIAGGDVNVPAGKSAFSDVAEGEWYTKYIAYCEAKGLLKSYSDTFAPNQNITRAEFAELIFNIGLLTDKGKNGVFTDVPASHPKSSVVAAAGKAGLVNGYANGDGTFSFKPDNTISREEVVTVINNAYGRSSDKAQLTSLALDRYYKDVTPDHWAFAGIIDASLLHFAYRENENGVDDWLFSEEVEVEFTEEEFTAAKEKVLEVDALTEKRISEIRNTETSVSVSGRKFYFAENGDDKNDGRTPEAPKKTIEALNALTLTPGDGVFFKRGDIFRGQVVAKKGVTYSAYGEGEKPRVYMSPNNFTGAENWEATEARNVWKLKTAIEGDVGIIVFDEGKAWTTKFLDGVADFTGRLDALTCNLGMWHDISDPGETGYVYLRCDDGNPGDLYSSIEVAPRSNTFSVKADDVTIDNICVMYTGAHGVGSGFVKNLTVTNCEFGWIGGSWHQKETHSRYGNAVEIYGGVEGYTIDNCYIYQIYDAGVTHQYSKGEARECIMKDVKYTNNVITYTTYPVEYFVGKPNAGIAHCYKNLEISDNIMRYTGYGWGDQRPNKDEAAHIKSWNTYNEATNFVIKNNIFDRSKYMLLEIGAESGNWLPKMEGNTYILTEGDDIGNIGDGTTIAVPGIEAYIKSRDASASVYVLKEGTPIG